MSTSTSSTARPRSPRSARRSALASLALAIAAGVMIAPEQPARACGPDFPTNLLIKRADALATMWEGSFAEEAGRLVPVSATDRDLFAQPPALVVAMPREQTLYSAAAAKFHAGDYAGAARGFEAVLRLPAHERERLSVAAAYSLGRARAGTWNNAQAIAAFRAVRALVRAGFVDDQGLALSSLGEEARVAMRTDTAAGIRLYAQQAGLGDPSGATSLLHVLRWQDAKALRAIAHDDVAVSAFALYFYTRDHELSSESRATWKQALARYVTSGSRGAAYMAAASYREGEWEAAARYARLSRAPIATWVEAKLALRDGDRAKAETLLRQVEAAGLAGNDGTTEIASYSLDSDPSSLVRAELGLLALASDRFTDAAEWFGKAQRAVEAGYVADRVMSMDELLAAVQRTQPLRATRPVAADGEPIRCEYRDPTNEQERAYCWGKTLLDIYARRLLRAHRYDEALEAFGADRPTKEDDADGDDSTDNDPDPAGTFVAEMKRAGATTGIERAEHLFFAARTLRRYGMEIAGTEVGPDWRIYDGGYAGETLCMPSLVHGYTRLAVPDEEGWYDEQGDDGCMVPSKADAAFVSSREASRVAASAPEVDRRFSYRYAASRLAEQAAGLVPPRSQAYASLLCWAARYASLDRARVDEIYAMYTRNGAAGFEIGANCEEPDFRRARNFDDEQAQLRADKIAAAQRAQWTWPRIRDAAWRRRGWLVYPLAAVLLYLLARFALSRAAYAPGFTRDDKK